MQFTVAEEETRYPTRSKPTAWRQQSSLLGARACIVCFAGTSKEEEEEEEEEQL